MYQAEREAARIRYNRSQKNYSQRQFTNYD